MISCCFRSFISCTAIIPYTPTAIIPYTPPVALEKFIRRKVERARDNSRVSESSAISRLFKSEIDSVSSLCSRPIRPLDCKAFKPISFRKKIGFCLASFDPTKSASMPYQITNLHRESILHSSEYGDLMKDPDVLFHGINAAIWKIPSILEFGILSKRAARNKGVFLGFNYGSETRLGVVNGYNGEAYISCARSPVHVDSVGDRAGAFGLYIKNGISFAVRGISAISSYNLREHDSGIPSEAMVDYHIPSESIIGLVVSISLLSTKIRAINFLHDGALGAFHLRCKSLLRYLEKKIDIDPSLVTAIAIPIGSEDERVRLEILFNGLILKYFSSLIDIESACFIDLLKILVPRGLSIYNTNGFKIS